MNQTCKTPQIAKNQSSATTILYSHHTLYHQTTDLLHMPIYVWTNTPGHLVKLKLILQFSTSNSSVQAGVQAGAISWTTCGKWMRNIYLNAQFTTQDTELCWRNRCLTYGIITIQNFRFINIETEFKSLLTKDSVHIYQDKVM